MKKLSIVLGMVLLGHTAIANAATDWTPYLKPMMSGCDFPNPTDKLPARYNASVVSKKVKIDPEDYDIIGYRGDKITTYTLKNATAFGQPLLKLEYLAGYEWGHLKLYFKDTKFTALRPQFKLPKVDNYPSDPLQVMKNNASGYEVEEMGYTNLIFDRKEKSITCFSGL